MSEEKAKSTELQNPHRRKTLQLLGTTGAAAAAAVAGFVAAEDAHASSPTNSLANTNSNTISLPLDMDHTHDFEVFVEAIGDAKVRAGLRQSSNMRTFPKGVLDLISMADDQQFNVLASDSIQKYVAYKHNQIPLGDVQVSGKQLYEYISTTYPVGTEALRKYGESVHPNGVRPNGSGYLAANIDVVANASIVANALGGVNVFGATDVAVAAYVAVAAAAVAIVAVVVD